MSTDTWDVARYDAAFGFVSSLGRGVVEQLAAQPGERIIDLGCGTGELAALIAATGASVEGLDADADMIDRARRSHPQVPFRVVDGHVFEVDGPVDAVFSNAALHWMLRPDEVIGRVHAALRPGGRFVAEFGGRGNVATIRAAVISAAGVVGIHADHLEDPWYFPSPAEHAGRLESAGFRVRSIELFDRPTPLSVDGVAGWLRMFGGRLLAGIPISHRAEVIAIAADRCRPTLLRDGTWFADYVRLRFTAERVG